MSLRQDFTLSGATLRGADDCDGQFGRPNQFERSCARYCVPTTYTTATQFALWIRAWRVGFGGRATVRIQRVASETATVSETSPTCTVGGVPSGCWTVLATNAIFSGRPFPNIRDTAGWVQFETTEQPGAGAASWPGLHMLTFVGNNDLLDQNWKIQAAPNYSSGIGTGEFYSHRTAVSGTAQYSGVWPGLFAFSQTTMISTPFSSYAAAPYRILRNDHVVANGVVRVNVDQDGDAIGPALESLLSTCDSRTGPTLNGISCSSLPGCASSMTTQCRQSLRDTDQDGLRDDVELYGAQLVDSLGSPISGGYLARYGANPARYDVFEEVDYRCAGTPNGATSSFTVPQAEAMASTYRSTTGSAMRNRDGSNGIWMHFDIGSTGSPTSIFGGNWGGSGSPTSGCITNPPACTTNAQCLGSGGVCTANVCTTYDYRAHFMRQQRRWLFRSMEVIASAGATRVRGLDGAAGFPAAMAHEIGHQGGLDHGGPSIATMDVEQNWSPGHLTRMNYDYQNVGGGNLDAADGLSPARIGFSDGTRSTISELAAYEECPFGSSVDYPLIDARTYHAGQVDYPGGLTCPNVDWNFDGVITPRPQTVEARLVGADAHIARRAPQDPVPGAFHSPWGPELITIGQEMVLLRVEGIVTGSTITNRLVMTRSTGSFVCSATPAPTGERYPPCAIVAMSGDIAGVFPGANDVTFADEPLAGPLLPVAVAAANSIDGNNAARGVVVWAESTGSLPFRYGTLYYGGLWTSHGTLGGAMTPATLSTGDGIPSMARVGGTQTLLLVYRNSAGNIVEQRASWNGGTLSWFAATTAISGAGGSFVGSPAIATLENTTLGANGVILAVERAVGSSVQMEFWHRSSGGVWTLGATLADSDIAQKQIIGRPSISPRPYRVGGLTRWRLEMTWREGAAGSAPALPVYRQSNFDTLATWRPAEQFFNDGFAALGYYPGVFQPEVFWDDRVSSSPQGLRGAYSQLTMCTPMVTACPGSSTCSPVDTGSPIQSCRSPTGLLQGAITVLPAADGVVPERLDDFNDWSELRHDFCQTLRSETVSFAPASAPFPAAGFQESSASCAPAPTYSR